MNVRRLNVILLGISLGLVGVVGYLIYLVKFAPVPVRYVPQTEVVTNKVTQIAVRKVNATNLFGDLLNRPWNWTALESTNYPTFIANLRGFGCPEETIRDIILTDIAKLYAKRRAELRARRPQPPYWQSEETFALKSPEYLQIIKQLGDLEREQRALVKQLLGVDFDRELAKLSEAEDPTPGSHLTFLPPEKGRQVTELLARYDEQEQRIYEGARGFMLPEDEQTVRALEKQRDAELAQLLTPEEYGLYQLHESPTAHNLRGSLGAFEASEEEFRKLFQAQKAIDDTTTMTFDDDPSKDADIRAQVQEEAAKELEKELKKALGEKRYAEYERAKDGDYQMLLNLGERFNMSQDKAVKVYEMKVAAQKQREQIENNPALTEDQRAVALLGIARETRRSVSEALGQGAFKAYQRMGGQWIEDLSADAIPLPPAPPGPDFLRR